MICSLCCKKVHLVFMEIYIHCDLQFLSGWMETPISFLMKTISNKDTSETIWLKFMAGMFWYVYKGSAAKGFWGQVWCKW